MLSNFLQYMLCESPHHLAWSGEILSYQRFSGFDPRLQLFNDILLTNYQKSSMIEVTKAKTKNIFTISKYISLNYILLLLCSYTH